MTITRRFSDTTELDAYIARTTRAVRLSATGPALGGTAYNEFMFDFVGSPTDHTVTQVDGLYYADISLEGIYDATMTTSWEVWMQNATAAAYTAT